MPIYEYRCDSCGTAFEELVFSDTRVTCPRCHVAKVTKQLSVPAPARAAAAKAADCASGLPPSSCCGGACHQH